MKRHKKWSHVVRSELRAGQSSCSNLSNFNYKPQVGSRQQHQALHVDRHLRSVAIMIEVTSCHMESAHCNPDLQLDACHCATMVTPTL